MSDPSPSQLFPYVRDFLYANGLTATAKALANELGVESLGSVVKGATLFDICKQWLKENDHPKEGTKKRKAESELNGKQDAKSAKHENDEAKGKEKKKKEEVEKEEKKGKEEKKEKEEKKSKEEKENKKEKETKNNKDEKKKEKEEKKPKEEKEDKKEKGAKNSKDEKKKEEKSKKDKEKEGKNAKTENAVQDKKAQNGVVGKKHNKKEESDSDSSDSDSESDSDSDSESSDSSSSSSEEEEKKKKKDANKKTDSQKTATPTTTTIKDKKADTQKPPTISIKEKPTNKKAISDDDDSDSSSSGSSDEEEKSDKKKTTTDKKPDDSNNSSKKEGSEKKKDEYANGSFPKAEKTAKSQKGNASTSNTPVSNSAYSKIEPASNGFGYQYGTSPAANKKFNDDGGDGYFYGGNSAYNKISTPKPGHKKFGDGDDEAAIPAEPASVKSPEAGGNSAKKNAPFKRVTEEDAALLKSEFADNSFQSKGGDLYGHKANEVLSKVKGDRFRHEKTKKKRGSYKGGPIDTNVNSVKYDYDD